MTDSIDQTVSSAEHNEILAKMRSIQTALDQHVSVDHAHYVPRPEVKAMIDKITNEAMVTSRKVEAIVTTIKGPVDEITGEHRDELGMEGKISQLYAMTQNGGLPASLVQSPQARADRTGIWIAAVSGVMVMITAIVVAYLQYG